MPSITKLCSIKNCQKIAPPGRKGWCLMHYTRWRSHGNPIVTRYDRSIIGVTSLPEYKPWQNMKARCLVTTNKHYADYGGRGIKICDRWRTSFNNFYADMGSRPSSKHEIERKNNNGDYTPENCRWATHQEQANNRRSNRNFTINGQTKTLKQWSDQYGCKYRTVWARINAGTPIEDALY